MAKAKDDYSDEGRVENETEEETKDTDQEKSSEQIAKDFIREFSKYLELKDKSKSDIAYKASLLLYFNYIKKVIDEAKNKKDGFEYFKKRLSYLHKFKEQVEKDEEQKMCGKYSFHVS